MSRRKFIFSTDLKGGWSNGIRGVDTYNFEVFYINFSIDKEQRSLFVTHTCSSDYKDIYDGDKIIFSLGKWGMCEEIMQVVIESVKEFGDVYYTPDDCSEEFQLIK